MASQRNPADRVSFLMRMFTAQRKQTKVRERWASAFKIDPKMRVDLYRCLSMLFDEIGNAERAVSEARTKDCPYVKGYPKLRSFLNSVDLEDISDRGGLARHGIDDNLLTTLNHAAYELEQHLPAVADFDEPERLKEIEGMISDFEKEISGPDALSPVVKEYIERSLEKLKRALKDYQIRGADALDDAVESVVGATAIILTKIKFEGSDKAAADKLWEILSRVATLGSLTQLAFQAGLIGHTLLSSG